MSNESGKKTEMKDLIIHGTQEGIDRWGNRLKFVIPGGEKLSPVGAVLTKMYGDSLDANLQRGEVYAWEDSKGLHIVEGYKLLVRWARRQADFFDTEEKLTAEEMEERGLDPAEDIAYRVWILREDKLPALERLAKLHKAIGTPEPYRAARSEIAQCSVGVVNKGETSEKPPKGWTWHEVAIKRALKNALNKSYGVPSPKEIAEETWRVGNVQTTEEDWKLVEEEMPDASKEQRELLAAAAAIERERKAEFDAMTPEEQEAKVADNSTLLFGPDDDDPLGADTIPQEPPPEDDEDDDEEPELPTDALTPDVIRRVCRYKARWQKGEAADWADAVRVDAEPFNQPIDNDTLVKVSAAVNTAISGRTQEDKDQKRHEVYLYLYNVDSGKKLTKLEGAAVLAWIGLPDGKIGDIKALARAEVEGILRAYQAKHGQVQMELEV